MTSTVLAITDLGETTGPQFDFVQYGMLAGITAVLGSIILLWVSSRWLIGVFRLSRRVSRPTFQSTYDPVPLIADARAHLDASKRHIAALEETLNQIQEQLKRRPLS